MFYLSMENKSSTNSDDSTEMETSSESSSDFSSSVVYSLEDYDMDILCPDCERTVVNPIDDLFSCESCGNYTCIWCSRSNKCQDCRNKTTPKYNNCDRCKIPMLPLMSFTCHSCERMICTDCLSKKENETCFCCDCLKFCDVVGCNNWTTSPTYKCSCNNVFTYCKNHQTQALECNFEQCGNMCVSCSEKQIDKYLTYNAVYYNILNHNKVKITCPLHTVITNCCYKCKSIDQIRRCKLCDYIECKNKLGTSASKFKHYDDICYNHTKRCNQCKDIYYQLTANKCSNNCCIKHVCIRCNSYTLDGKHNKDNDNKNYKLWCKNHLFECSICQTMSPIVNKRFVKVNPYEIYNTPICGCCKTKIDIVYKSFAIACKKAGYFLPKNVMSIIIHKSLEN